MLEEYAADHLHPTFDDSDDGRAVGRDRPRCAVVCIPARMMLPGELTSIAIGGDRQRSRGIQARGQGDLAVTVRVVLEGRSQSTRSPPPRRRRLTRRPWNAGGTSSTPTSRPAPPGARRQDLIMACRHRDHACHGVGRGHLSGPSSSRVTPTALLEAQLHRREPHGLDRAPVRGPLRRCTQHRAPSPGRSGLPRWVPPTSATSACRCVDGKCRRQRLTPDP